MILWPMMSYHRQLLLAGAGHYSRRVPRVQRLAACGGEALADDLSRGRDALPRVRPWASGTATMSDYHAEWMQDNLSIFTLS